MRCKFVGGYISPVKRYAGIVLKPEHHVHFVVTRGCHVTWQHHALPFHGLDINRCHCNNKITSKNYHVIILNRVGELNRTVPITMGSLTRFTRVGAAAGQFRLVVEYTRDGRRFRNEQDRSVPTGAIKTERYIPCI